MSNRPDIQVNLRGEMATKKRVPIGSMGRVFLPIHVHPRKFTCHLKIDGWEDEISFWDGPFLGDMFIFRGGVVVYGKCR